MPDYLYSGLPVNVVRDEDAGLYVFGIEMGGVFVPLVYRKLGGIDADLARAAENQPAPQPTQPAETATASTGEGVATVTDTTAPEQPGTS